MTLPPGSVKRAFGVDGDAEMLAGGYETSVRVGDAVLKRVMDLDVAHFCQEAISGLSLESVIAPMPMRSVAGAWSVEGWTATTYVEGLTSVRSDPALLIRVGREVAAALAETTMTNDRAVRERSDRWAVAERFAFGELEISLSSETHRIVELLRARTSADAMPPQLIHADLAGNVFVDPHGVPVMLDFTPAFRSVGFQSGVVIADSLLWGNGNAGDVALLAGDEASLARGLLFRLAAAELSPGEVNVDRPRCERAMSDLGWR